VEGFGFCGVLRACAVAAGRGVPHPRAFAQSIHDKWLSSGLPPWLALYSLDHAGRLLQSILSKGEKPRRLSGAASFSIYIFIIAG
jgi:hypothetical protein